MIIQTDRLTLRPINIEDKEAIFSYRSDVETNKYQGWIPKTLEDTESFIEKSAIKANIAGTWFQLVIIEKETKKIVGDIGIHFLDDDMQIEIGCTLNKNFQNIGYATEALKCIIDYLFKTLNKHRIFTSIDPDNTNSIRLVERIGFRKEAHFKESLFINEQWFDDVVYALLNKEWK